MAFRFHIVMIALVVALLHVVLLGNFLSANPTTIPIAPSNMTAVLIPPPEVNPPELAMPSEPLPIAQSKITPMPAPATKREPVVRKSQVNINQKTDVNHLAPKRVEVKPTTTSAIKSESLPIAPATEHSPVAKSEPVAKESAVVRETAVKEATVKEAVVKESPSKDVAAKESALAPVAAVKTTLPQHRAGYLNNPKPHYPESSREEGEEGKVLVKVMVRADGSAGEVKLQKSSGFPRLDRAALDAVKQWRFVPAKRGDEPIDMWYTVPIPFELN